MYRFLMKAKAFGVPWAKICWGTDYPGFELPESLLPKFKSLNEEARVLTEAEIPDDEIHRMLGENFEVAARIDH